MDEKNLIKTAKGYYKKLNKIVSKCKFFTVDDVCEIKYMSNSKYRWNILLRGPMSVKLREDNSIFERDNLRQGTKNYYKFFYKDNALLKIESYVNGRIDCVFLCYYFENLRILKPFTVSGDFYPTYSLITSYSQNKVEKEVWLDDDQIILETYTYKDNFIDYEFANMAPNSPKHKILSYLKGVFTDASNYTETENFSWLDK